MRRQAAVWAVVAVVALAACGSEATDTVGSVPEPMEPTAPIQPSEPSESTEPAAPAATPTTFAVTPLEPDVSSGSGSGDVTVPDDGTALDPESRLVSAAVADLAARLGVGADDVEVVEARAVTWPDSSLGCPEPGMNYLQRLVDGAFVMLEVDGRQYPYHGGDPLQLCEPK